MLKVKLLKNDSLIFLVLVIFFLEAVEIITGHPEDEQETACKKKTYDLKLKTLK